MKTKLNKLIAVMLVGLFVMVIAGNVLAANEPMGDLALGGKAFDGIVKIEQVGVLGGGEVIVVSVYGECKKEPLLGILIFDIDTFKQQYDGGISDLTEADLKSWYLPEVTPSAHQCFDISDYGDRWPLGIAISSCEDFTPVDGVIVECELMTVYDPD